MNYSKLPLSLDEQIKLLQQRGLLIDDKSRAIRWLTHVSYYRLSAYCLPFKSDQVFQPGTTFHDIAGLYIFDRKLRLLVLDAIERIEVAIRTALTTEIAQEYGVFGHTDPLNFSPKLDHPRFIRELQGEESRARELFSQHFRQKYSNELHLPVWMASELLSFGTISKLYSCLRPNIKQRIAATYKTQDHLLSNWLHVLNYIRNICAHHKRLWNRQLAIRPKLPSRKASPLGDVPNSAQLYAAIAITQYLMLSISPHSQWSERLKSLLIEHPSVPKNAMGFPENWERKKFGKARAYKPCQSMFNKRSFVQPKWKFICTPFFVPIKCCKTYFIINVSLTTAYQNGYACASTAYLLSRRD